MRLKTKRQFALEKDGEVSRFKEFVPVPGAEVVSEGWSVYPAREDKAEGQPNERKNRRGRVPGGECTSDR
ncbi:hypothetical protein D3C85_1706630 [compost metagenome]